MKVLTGIVITSVTQNFSVEGFVPTAHKNGYRIVAHPTYLVPPELTEIVSQVSQLDPSAIVSQVSQLDPSALPDLPQVIESAFSGIVQQDTADLSVDFLSTLRSQFGAFVTSAPVVNAGVGVSAFLIGNKFGNIENKELKTTVEGLQSDLEETQIAEEKLKSEISLYEDQIFELEAEFENGTGELKKSFQDTLAQEKDKIRQKVKKELSFTVDRKMREERSKLLREKREFMQTERFEKTIELSSLRLNKSYLESTAQTMQTTVTELETEVEKFRSLANKKTGFWPVNVINLRMQRSELERNIAKMSDELKVKDSALNDAKEEIEDLNNKLTSKSRFWRFITRAD